MTEQRWEYCMLGLDEMREPEEGEEGTWGYSCWVEYYAPTGTTVSQTLGDIDQPLAFNPFKKAMGLLGAAGWELVSAQHGNTGDEYDDESSNLRMDERVAYFKRPVQSGRATDEPKLAL